MTGKLLDSPEAAALLNVSKAWLEERNRLGDGPGFKIAGGRAWRYSRDELPEWIAAQRSSNGWSKRKPRRAVGQ